MQEVYLGDITEFSEISGFSKYLINRDGLVISIASGEPKVVSIWISKTGYPSVTLRRDSDGKKENKNVHRLLAEAFIENPNGYSYVRHYDDDKLNNDLNNLVWGTAKDNRADMIRNGHDTCQIPVYCYENDTTYPNGREAAKALGCTPSAITFACQGKIGNIHKHHVCYEKDKEEKLSNLDEWLKERTGKKPLYGQDMSTGNVYEFESRNEAAAYAGIPACGISLVVNHPTKLTHGWKFWE